jgi:hypothetical protein
VDLGVVDIKWIGTADNNNADILSKIDIHGQNYTSKATKLLGKHQRSSEDSLLTSEKVHRQTVSAPAKRSNNFKHNDLDQQNSVTTTELTTSNGNNIFQ